MPRLGFSKSRRGCFKCKQRRVKCDERRPTCSACKRHGVLCSFSDASSTAASDSIDGQTTTRACRATPSQASSEPESRTSPTASSNSPAALEERPFPYLSNLVKTPEPASLESGTKDLELMHHYTAITWKSLPRAERIGYIWQFELPRLAFNHDYLMHQMLAISAYHMARLYPERQSAYHVRGTQHQNKAIQLLQPALLDITNTNCPAVFLTASLLSVGEFAVLASCPQRSRVGIDDLLRVFLLMRGMSGILQSYEDTIALSAIGYLLHMESYQSESMHLDRITDELTAIRPSDTTDPTVMEILQQGVDSLVYCIGKAKETSEIPRHRTVVFWPIELSESFVSLLRQRNKDALKVLDYYCQILESQGQDDWYMEGWGTKVREDIYQSCKE